MKTTSASIVVLSGALVLCAAAANQNGSMSAFICFMGVLIAAVGIAGWIGALIGKFN